MRGDNVLYAHILLTYNLTFVHCAVWSRVEVGFRKV